MDQNELRSTERHLSPSGLTHLQISGCSFTRDLPPSTVLPFKLQFLSIPDDDELRNPPSFVSALHQPTLVSAHYPLLGQSPLTPTSLNIFTFHAPLLRRLDVSGGRVALGFEKVQQFFENCSHLKEFVVNGRHLVLIDWIPCPLAKLTIITNLSSHVPKRCWEDFNTRLLTLRGGPRALRELKKLEVRMLENSVQSCIAKEGKEMLEAACVCRKIDLEWQK